MFLKIYGGRFPISLFDKSLKTIITTATKISLMMELLNSQKMLFTGAFAFPFQFISPKSLRHIPKKKVNVLNSSSRRSLQIILAKNATIKECLIF